MILKFIGEMRMKKLKSKETLLNVIFSLLLQICNIISTFIIPKIILSYFGSNVNGLVASLTQFLSYISLIEGGITGVITASLYKPLVKKDNKKISSILKTTDSFFKKIGFIFIVYSLILGVLYPLLSDTEFSFLYIFTLTIVLSLNLLIQYMYSLTLRTLLNADKKVYIVSLTQIIIIILNIILVLISVKVYPSIHLLKFISGVLFLLQPIVYNRYVNKYYSIDKDAPIDNKLLNARWNGFAINLAAFIHFSTDITILTVFTNLVTVSIYSVYALVSTGLRTIINSVATGINPTIGQAYAKGDIDELNAKMDLYEYIINSLVFFAFSVAGLLITPFVLIYTQGITDANYNQPLFGYLLLVSEALYLLKFPHLNLAYSANKFKEITKPAFIEAILNIIISIILVSKFGLIGVAIGTIIAMIYRMIFHVWYTKNLIKDWNQWSFYKKVIIFLITSCIGITICLFLGTPKLNFISWGLYAIIYSLIFSILFGLMSFIFFKKEIKYFRSYLFKKNK